MLTTLDYTLIETADALKNFYDTNRHVEWLALDTEFIGERRYETLLCLIQVASPNGYFLIDPIKITDLTDFLRLIEDEKILKLTHAGENDYRLLNQNWGDNP